MGFVSSFGYPYRQTRWVYRYGDAASWMYSEAMGAGDRTAATLIAVQEVRHIHHLAMTLVWQISPHPDATDAEIAWQLSGATTSNPSRKA